MVDYSISTGASCPKLRPTDDQQPNRGHDMDSTGVALGFGLAQPTRT